MKTQLKDRTLWFDGTSEVAAELVPELLLAMVPLEKIVVKDPNDDIVKFNQLSDIEIASSKEKNDTFDLTWNVPDEFMNSDFKTYIRSLLKEMLTSRNITESMCIQYRNRAEAELDEIVVRGIEPLFKTLVYVIHKFRELNVVWGVGRGSSCASLVLYIMGLHKVDPVKYNIDMMEFFHD